MWLEMVRADPLGSCFSRVDSRRKIMLIINKYISNKFLAQQLADALRLLTCREQREVF